MGFRYTFRRVFFSFIHEFSFRFNWASTIKVRGNDSNGVASTLRVPDHLFASNVHFSRAHGHALSRHYRSVLRQFNFVSSFRALPVGSLALFARSFVMFRCIFANVVIVTFRSFLNKFRLFKGRFTLSSRVFHFVVRVRFTPSLLSTFQSRTSRRIIFR